MIENPTVAQEIIQNATQLFLTRGFKSVTMDDLATEMGMSKKTIYTHFKNKSELVKASSIHIFCFISTGIDHIRSQKHNPIEELFKIKDFVLKNLKNESSSPEYQLLKYYPKIHSELTKKKFVVVHECVIESLNKGIESGIFRKQIDVEIISRIYFMAINGLKNQEIFPLNEFPAHQLTPIYLDYHIRGIATKKGREILEELQQKRLKNK